MRPSRINRRHAMQAIGAAAVAPAMGRRGFAQANAAARLIFIADLHSAYDRLAQLLAAIEAAIADSAVPHAILVNGDVFEANNVVASRSGGAPDWAFLAELARLAPTVLNIGNHEPDLVADLSEAVTRARDAGLLVISNISDARDGKSYADASVQLALGASKVTAVGIATDAIGTYPAGLRDALAIPEPVAWARENLPRLIAPGTIPVVLSHAGVVSDKAILPLLGEGSLLVGGHDHLLFQHAQGGVRYVHTGSWASAFGLVDLGADQGAVELVGVDRGAPRSETLAAIISSVLTEHLTDAETAIVGKSRETLTLGETGRAIAAAMAEAAGADAGFINHTTLGTGFPQGDVSRFAFDAVVRFDGMLTMAEIDAAGFAELMQRANQDGEVPLAERTGDFLYAAPVSNETKAAYRIVTNSWAAANQRTYFGRDDLAFTEVPRFALKEIAARALAR